MRGMAEPQEIGAAVAFLASERASYIPALPWRWMADGKESAVIEGVRTPTVREGS